MKYYMTMLLLNSPFWPLYTNQQEYPRVEFMLRVWKNEIRFHIMCKPFLFFLRPLLPLLAPAKTAKAPAMLDLAYEEWKLLRSFRKSKATLFRHYLLGFISKKHRIYYKMSKAPQNIQVVSLRWERIDEYQKQRA